MNLAVHTSEGHSTPGQRMPGRQLDTRVFRYSSPAQTSITAHATPRAVVLCCLEPGTRSCARAVAGVLFLSISRISDMWITQEKLPLGEHIARYVEWLTQHGAGVFDAISLSLSGVISAFTSALLWFNPLALIAVFALLGLLHPNARPVCTFFVTLSFLLIFNLGYWQETMETLAQATFATLVCVVIGVPLGIVAAHRPWFYAALRPVLDLMQTVPTFVYLIPTLTLFGLEVVPGLISTVVFAIAAPIRLTYLGIRDVPDELMDAGKAFGCPVASSCRALNCPMRCRASWPASPSASCCRCRWW